LFFVFGYVFKIIRANSPISVRYKARWELVETVETWLKVALGAVVGTFVICLILGLGALAWLFRERQNYEAKVRDARLGVLSQAGVEARKKYSARRQMAILEAMSLIKDGKDVKEALMAVAQKYPDVAALAMSNPSLLLSEVKRMGLANTAEYAAVEGELEGQTKLPTT
jgi:hypothetical protein